MNLHQAIDRGCTGDWLDSNGGTYPEGCGALVYASAYNRVDAVERLLLANAQPGEWHRGVAAVDVAATNCHMRVVALLVRNGADGATALLRAVRNDDVDMASMLITRFHTAPTAVHFAEISTQRMARTLITRRTQPHPGALPLRAIVDLSIAIEAYHVNSISRRSCCDLQHAIDRCRLGYEPQYESDAAEYAGIAHHMMLHGARIDSTFDASVCSLAMVATLYEWQPQLFRGCRGRNLCGAVTRARHKGGNSPARLLPCSRCSGCKDIVASDRALSCGRARCLAFFGAMTRHGLPREICMHIFLM